MEILRREGNWKALHEVVCETLEHVPLPSEIERWAGDVRRNVEPLTRLDHRLRVLPPAKFDPSYVCDHPLMARVEGEGEQASLLFGADAARPAFFGRIVTFRGGPLRLGLST